MTETQTITARKSKETENYAVYDSPEPEQVADDFKQALSGMYVNLDAFSTEAPEVIDVILGDEETAAMELDASKTSDHTQQFERGDAIVAMYVAHRLYDEQVPEDLFLSIDATATLEDWEEAVERVEDEFGVRSEEDEGMDGLVVNEGDSDEAETTASDESEEEEELSEDEEELAELVEEAA